MLNKVEYLSHLRKKQKICQPSETTRGMLGKQWSSWGCTGSKRFAKEQELRAGCNSDRKSCCRLETAEEALIWYSQNQLKYSAMNKVCELQSSENNLATWLPFSYVVATCLHHVGYIKNIITRIRSTLQKTYIIDVCAFKFNLKLFAAVGSYSCRSTFISIPSCQII